MLANRLRVIIAVKVRLFIAISYSLTMFIYSSYCNSSDCSVAMFIDSLQWQ